MELSRDPFALSDLIGKPVCDSSGRRLGRAFEVRRTGRAASGSSYRNERENRSVKY